MNDAISITDTGFCDWGCGMFGVQHSAQDALCAQRILERFPEPGCSLQYFPVAYAERLIAEGRMRREWFLLPTPDGYLPLRTRITHTPDGGALVEIGDNQIRLGANEVAAVNDVALARTIRNAIHRGPGDR